MHQALFPSTLERYKDKVRFIYKDYPLSEMHPWAMHAAVDANCLAVQSPEVYWTYVDYLHAHGQEVSGEDRDINKSFAALDRIARQEGTLAKVDSSKLDACLAKQDETQVRASVKEGDKLGSIRRPRFLSMANGLSAPFPKIRSGWSSIAHCAPRAKQPPHRRPLRPQGSQQM